MGMDVYGKKPLNKEGEYFRNNVWWWHPLWSYCEQVAPEITVLVQHGHSNDGDGLDAHASKMLAKVLRDEVSSGRCAAYQKEWQKQLDDIPDGECTICAGTGKRKEAPNIGAGSIHCNGCDGKGHKPPMDKWHHFNVENVEEFATFLENCGGFEIH